MDHLSKDLSSSRNRRAVVTSVLLLGKLLALAGVILLQNLPGTYWYGELVKKKIRVNRSLLTKAM